MGTGALKDVGRPMGCLRGKGVKMTFLVTYCLIFSGILSFLLSGGLAGTGAPCWDPLATVAPCRVLTRTGASSRDATGTGACSGAAAGIGHPMGCLRGKGVKMDFLVRYCLIFSGILSFYLSGGLAGTGASCWDPSGTVETCRFLESTGTSH